MLAAPIREARTPAAHNPCASSACATSLPNEATLVSHLKDCASRNDLHAGRRLHSTIVKWGSLDTNVIIGNALITVYVKCRDLAQAHGVFHQLPVRDVASWTSLIGGCVHHGRCHEALRFFSSMQSDGVAPNESTFACVLKACSTLGAVDKGRELHAQILGKGWLGTDGVLGNALLDMYSKCGAIRQAHHLFGELPNRSIISWNALISGYCQQGKVAFHLLKELEEEGQSPDAITYICLMKACGSTGSLKKGLEIHAEAARHGYLECFRMLGNALVDMYARCGKLALAQEVLEELSIGSIVSWTALMTGYCHLGHHKEALKCLEQLKKHGLHPNAVTYLYVLKACGGLGDAEVGKAIHDEIANKGLLRIDRSLGSALVEMYSKCGELAKARDAFDELPVRDVVSWTNLITEYCQHEHGQQSLECFEHMQVEGFLPDPVTFAVVLNACSSIGALQKGKEVHAEISRQGLLGKWVFLASALVDMYAKCSVPAQAQEVFDSLPTQDVASWTALISGYAQVGQHEGMQSTFNEMCSKGMKPNPITFMTILSACGVMGLVDEGQTYYDIMSSHYGIFPTSKHVTCMVNLFGRQGQLDMALAMMEKIASVDSLPALCALLSSCKKEITTIMLGNSNMEFKCC